jgi:hypothetical protein
MTRTLDTMGGPHEGTKARRHEGTKARRQAGRPQDGAGSRIADPRCCDVHVRDVLRSSAMHLCMTHGQCTMH